jgi:hypothetical protein
MNPCRSVNRSLLRKFGSAAFTLAACAGALVGLGGAAAASWRLFLLGWNFVNPQ